jgi:transcriptional/translational regulatory protein YebC/TACO1
VFVEADDVSNQAKLFKNRSYDIQVAEAVWIPNPEDQLRLDGSSELGKKFTKLMKKLEAEEDVTAVYSNTTIQV